MERVSAIGKHNGELVVGYSDLSNDLGQELYSYSADTNSFTLLYDRVAGAADSGLISDIFSFAGKIYYQTSTGDQIIVFDPSTGSGSVVASDLRVIQYAALNDKLFLYYFDSAARKRVVGSIDGENNLTVEIDLNEGFAPALFSDSNNLYVSLVLPPATTFAIYKFDPSCME